MDKKYGLLLRAPPSKKKQQPLRPPLPKAAGFADDDDDDVEKEISRHASKNKSLRDIEQQHKKALEEDPTVFDYDGVYDEMKDQAVRPRAQDRQERRPKYIQGLMDKAKQRAWEQDVVYERKLAKERTKDDHLFAGKDKFITSAYKKKLAELKQWSEEERRRELREEKDDVTKKSDITDFYFSLAKNVAYGATDAAKKEAEAPRQEKEQPPSASRSEAGPSSGDAPASRSEAGPSSSDAPAKAVATAPSRADEKHTSETLPRLPPKPQDPIPSQTDEPGPEQAKADHHKRNQDVLAAARERFNARKKAKAL